MPSLTDLPSELQTAILRFVATSTDPAQQVRDLVSVARTCHFLHHTVFCDSNDRLWCFPAVALGIHPSVCLEDVLYPGSSTIQKRRWLNIVKLNLAWGKPFASGVLAWPKVQRVRTTFPAANQSGDWFGRRTIELAAPGEGGQKSPAYLTKHVTSGSGGSALFSVAAPKTRSRLAGVLDPALGKAKVVGSDAADKPKWTITPFPCSAGYVLGEGRSNYIREIDADTGTYSRAWDLKQRKVDRFVSNRDILVAVSFPEPGEQNSHIASSLVCLEAGKNSSDVLWEFDISDEWKEDDDYYQFAHLKNFHMTRSHVVCLVTRHPNFRLGKLTRTEFIVLELRTGKVVRSILVNPEIASPNAGSAPRAPFTTAFKHDFLLTDTFIVSGGPGGGLFVWNYTGHTEPLSYTIPDPQGLDVRGAGEFPRQYSDLTISADGRYVGATTSDQLLVFDMVLKQLDGVYSNGRRVEKKDLYVKNPADDFPGGVWCWCTDWKSVRNESTGDVEWKEMDSRVLYLTDLLDPAAIAKSRGFKLRMAMAGVKQKLTMNLVMYLVVSLCAIGLYYWRGGA